MSRAFKSMFYNLPLISSVYRWRERHKIQQKAKVVMQKLERARADAYTSQSSDSASPATRQYLECLEARHRWLENVLQAAKTHRTWYRSVSGALHDLELLDSSEKSSSNFHHFSNRAESMVIARERGGEEGVFVNGASGRSSLPSYIARIEVLEKAVVELEAAASGPFERFVSVLEKVDFTEQSFDDLCEVLTLVDNAIEEMTAIFGCPVTPEELASIAEHLDGQGKAVFHRWRLDYFNHAASLEEKHSPVDRN